MLSAAKLGRYATIFLIVFINEKYIQLYYIILIILLVSKNGPERTVPNATSYDHDRHDHDIVTIIKRQP